MRRALLLLAFGLLSPGCELALLTGRNIAYEVSQCRDTLLECCRNRDLAEQAWEEVQKASPGHTFSVHYAQGFKDGYAEYLAEGGCGEPPALPPCYYLKPSYESPEGHKAVEDWFAGYRQGAARAKESGYRQFVVAPSSVASAPPLVPPIVPPKMVGPLPLPPLPGEVPPAKADDPAVDGVLGPPRKVAPLP